MAGKSTQKHQQETLNEHGHWMNNGPWMNKGVPGRIIDFCLSLFDNLCLEHASETKGGFEFRSGVNLQMFE